MRKIIFILLLFAALSVVAPSFAQSDPDSDLTCGNVWVVSVGVGKYIRPSFQALNYANDGARKFAQAVADARPQSTNIYILTSDSSDLNLLPNKTNLLRTINELGRKVASNDLVILYFCGHGIEDNGQQRLLLMDADLSDKDTADASCIQLSALRDKLEALPSQGRLLFMDACRENPRQAGGVFDAAPMTGDFLRAGGSWNPAKGKVSATFFGCQEGEKVYYGKKGQSFFTEALVEGLSGKAADSTGAVTLKSLSDYVQKTVPKAISDELGTNMRQQPILMPMPNVPVVLKPTPGFIACPAFGGDFGDLYAEKVQTRLAESGQLYLVERALLAKAIAELQLQDSGITDPASAAKLGNMINAKYVLLGMARPTPDGKTYISAGLVEVATGRKFPGVAADITCYASDWEYAAQTLADKLYNQMLGTSIIDKTCPIPAKPKVKPRVETPVKPVIEQPKEVVKPKPPKSVEPKKKEEKKQMPVFL